MEHTAFRTLFGEAVRRKRRASAGTLKTPVHFGGENPEATVPRVSRRARLRPLGGLRHVSPSISKGEISVFHSCHC